MDKQQTVISSTPKHYQGTIQPIDLINAQNLNFNLGNVVKYVCRAGKKQGENILSDLETLFAQQCQYRQHCLTQTYQKTKK